MVIPCLALVFTKGVNIRDENCKTHYHTFVDGMYVGTFNYVELEKLFKLNKFNVLGYMKGKNVRRIEKLKITLERV